MSRVQKPPIGPEHLEVKENINLQDSNKASQRSFKGGHLKESRGLSWFIQVIYVLERDFLLAISFFTRESLKL